VGEGNAHAHFLPPYPYMWRALVAVQGGHSHKQSTDFLNQ